MRLRELPSIDSEKDAREIAYKIQAGIATAYNITNDGRFAGYFITEKFENELVVLAMQTFENLEVFNTILVHLETLGRSQNCIGISFVTIRPGLIKKSAQFGFNVSSVTLRKSL